ncbi:hypothetical protein [Ancylobacter sp. G4_0304]|uniref:hypothetical protein n=1 Tax=Ancylobacter sp. G4_0304 TaxID=3114289 RepID=UPI0039C6E40F
MSTGRRIRWDNVSTVVSATILVGVEFLGAGLALGWAIAALFEASLVWEIIFEGAFAVIAFYAICRFFIRAKGIEPFVEG